MHSRNIIIENIINNEILQLNSYKSSCKVSYPCGICKKKVNKNQKAIRCDNCGLWVHSSSNDTTNEEYNLIQDSNNKSSTWNCLVCCIRFKHECFPFTLSDPTELDRINNASNMKVYDKLANFEIRSLTSKLSLLNSHDIDAQYP